MHIVVFQYPAHVRRIYMVLVDLSDTFEYHLAVLLAPILEYEVIATPFILAFRVHFCLTVSRNLLQVKTSVFTELSIAFVDLCLQTIDTFFSQLGQLLVEF